MPPVKKSSSKPAAAAVPTMPTKPDKERVNGLPKSKTKKTEQREIIYPKLNAIWFIEEEDDDSGECVEEGNNIAKQLTLDKTKEILGWMDEKQYAAHVLAKNPKAKKHELDMKEEYTLKLGKDKIFCANNAGNRRFNMPHAQEIAQDILNRHYAGARGREGDTTNCETIIIGRTGLVLSAQHRLIGHVIACLWWLQAVKDKTVWSQNWLAMPTLPALVVFGCSEDPEVVKTLDNTLPRDFGDAVYTSTTFADLGNSGKAECSRMMKKAVDLLWKRLRLSDKEGGNRFEKMQTVSACQSFAARHKRLEKCVRHLHGCDSKDGRAISKFNLSSGECSAMMYLMGCCLSDGDVYRNQDEQNEKKLNWKMWDKAEEFWTLLAGQCPDTMAVTDALKRLEDPENSTSGRAVEKRMIVCMGWKAFAEHGKVKDKDVILPVTRNKDTGEDVWDEWPDFGGIDLGDRKAKEAAAKDSSEVPMLDEAEGSDEYNEGRQSEVGRLQAEIDKSNGSGAKSKKGSGKKLAPVKEEPTKPAKPLTRKQQEAANRKAAEEADAKLAEEAEEEADEQQEEVKESDTDEQQEAAEEEIPEEEEASLEEEFGDGEDEEQEDPEDDQDEDEEDE